MTAGFFTGAAAMVWAAVLQHYIYKVRTLPISLQSPSFTEFCNLKSSPLHAATTSPLAKTQLPGDESCHLSTFGRRAAREYPHLLRVVVC
jgi:hypothetical protein